MTPRVIVLVLFLSVLVCPNRGAAADQVKITGTYTEYRYSQESGDLNGMEIRIVPVPGGYQGIVQEFFGEPQNVHLVDVRVVDQRISFSFSDFSTLWIFEGTVSRDGIRGELRPIDAPPSRRELLKRGQGSIWD